MRKLALVWLCLFSAGACGREPAHVGLDLRVPAGLLDQATAVQLLVSAVSDGASCTNDAVSGETNPQSFDLQPGGCAAPASWCTTINLPKDGRSYVFHVVAQSGGNPLAQGCAVATIDQDPLSVSVQVKRFLAPSCCNDGIVQPTEQCDTGIIAMGANKCGGITPDPVCGAGCQANEILLSVPGQQPPADNAPGSKQELSLAFSGPSGSPEVQHSLRAVYTDTGAGTLGGSDVDVRLLTGTLYPVSDMTSPLARQLRLPLLCSNVGGYGESRVQKTPSIAPISADTSAIVFLDNDWPGLPSTGQYNVSLSLQGGNGCAEKYQEVSDSQPFFQVNTNTASGCDAPAVAGGPDGQALVVWTQAGQLRGRIVTAQGMMPPTFNPASSDLAIGTVAAMGVARVAGGNNGWTVVYPGANGVFFRTVSLSGTVGAETQVNLAAGGDQPAVAMQPDGRAAVLWRSGGKVFFQRYDASGKPLPGDQDRPLTLSSPPASDPVIAGGANWYAAAWTAGDGTIWARFLGANGGFGYNHVTGQNDDFPASDPTIKHQRSGPAAAIGGGAMSGPQYVAIGWQDNDNSDPNQHWGIIVRRFPLPE